MASGDGIRIEVGVGRENVEDELVVENELVEGGTVGTVVDEVVEMVHPRVVGASCNLSASKVSSNVTRRVARAVVDGLVVEGHVGGLVVEQESEKAGCSPMGW